MKRKNGDKNAQTPFQLSLKFHNSIYDILCDIDYVKKNNKLKYLNVASVFDIEVSSFYNNENIKQCCMYAWVFGINGKCIKGRTWKEFLDVIKVVQKIYNTNLENRIIIYIHNLSYEFQFFRKYFEWEKVFAIDDRKPLYAITKSGIEFRCSYLLTGYSLEKVGEHLTKYKISKKVGDLDYNLIRHPETTLSDQEWGYILGDGLVVMAHIQEEIERLGGITKLPLTKTGYVRNLCRENCLKNGNRWGYTKTIKNLTLTPNSYKQLKRGYMGGFTHANSNYVNKLLHNVYSYDFTSSYPTVMIAEKYPMSVPHLADVNCYEEFLRYLKTFCCIFEAKFYNIMSTTEYENYISISRCIEKENYIINNGRVVEADYLRLTITEQDFFIIQKMYKWEEIEITNMYYFHKDYLPKTFIETILELYKDKTELKGVEGKEVEYLNSKEMINSLYGMSVTDPCKNEITYTTEWIENEISIENLIDKYNNNRQRFLYYAWGIWVTAYARANLFSGIFEFKNDYIYSDTDSLKVFNIDKHTEYINRYNEEITNKLKKCLKYHGIDSSMLTPKTIEGKPKPLGVWDYEGKYTRFKTLGAKRYMVEQDGNISITIAGVGKKAGLEYLRTKYKTNDKIFEAFEENLYFPSHYEKDGEDCNGSGKLLHTYIDDDMCGEVIDYIGNKYIYYEKGGIHMENTDYTLSLDIDFVRYLLGIKGGHLT